MVLESGVVNYYVDESGNFQLFKKSKVPVSFDEGASKVLMLGLLEIRDADFKESFDLLKRQVLSDAIFRSFPSFEKTQKQFHAKDDHIAVKREVFNYIAKLNCSVQVVIRRKATLIEEAKAQFEYNKTKMTDKRMYDDLVKRLFKQNMHKADRYSIYFAYRGKTFTNHTLELALQSTKEDFITERNIRSASSFRVICAKPHNHPELQIIDYCLWALQRLYERGEDLYFNIIHDKFSFILDVDDKRKSITGEHYWRKNPISLKCVGGIS